jgi:hypothetical protein
MATTMSVQVSLCDTPRAALRHCVSQAIERWEGDKAAAWKQHELDVKQAKETHADSVAMLRSAWERKKEEVRGGPAICSGRGFDHVWNS